MEKLREQINITKVVKEKLERQLNATKEVEDKLKKKEKDISNLQIKKK